MDMSVTKGTKYIYIYLYICLAVSVYKTLLADLALSSILVTLEC